MFKSGECLECKNGVNCKKCYNYNGRSFEENKKMEGKKMEKINKSFNYNNCSIEIKFTSSDKYGADRHYIFLNKAMLPTLKQQCFKESENEIIEYAKQLTTFMTCTC